MVSEVVTPKDEHEAIFGKVKVDMEAILGVPRKELLKSLDYSLMNLRSELVRAIDRERAGH